MKSVFIEKFQKVSRNSSTAMNEIFQELAGDNTEASNKLAEER